MEEKIRLAVFGQKRLSREGGIEIVVKELCTRMAKNGCEVTCYNRAGHHVSGAEYDKTIEYDGIRQKVVPTIEKKGLAAVSSSFFAALCSAFGRYDVVHIHAEGPAFFCWIPKLFGKRVISTIHGLDWAREKWKFGVGSKFIRQGEKNAVKYADEIIVLSKGVQKYFMETYGSSSAETDNVLAISTRTERLGTFVPFSIWTMYADMSSGRIMNLMVTIPAESRRMNVGKDVIRVLGSPTYICVLQRKDRKSIAITPCTAEHPMSFKVPDRLLTDGQCRMMINGIQFIQALLEANELAVGKDYQFKGRYEAEKNAVIISLEKDEREW